MIPAVAVGFALLGGLLLWLVAGTRGAWWLKLGAIVVTLGFTFAVWRALDSFSGWPTEATPPERALLVSSSVDEPDAIYLWLVPQGGFGPLGYRSDDQEPRAYRMPYTRELHEQVDRASALARRGQLVELRRVPGRQGPTDRGRLRLEARRVPGPTARKDERG